MKSVSHVAELLSDTVSGALQKRMYELRYVAHANSWAEVAVHLVDVSKGVNIFPFTPAGSAYISIIVQYLENFTDRTSTEQVALLLKKRCNWVNIHYMSSPTSTGLVDNSMIRYYLNFVTHYLRVSSRKTFCHRTNASHKLRRNSLRGGWMTLKTTIVRAITTLRGKRMPYRIVLKYFNWDDGVSQHPPPTPRLQCTHLTWSPTVCGLYLFSLVHHYGNQLYKSI